MKVKWIGAICVIFGCGGWGVQLALQHITRIRTLRSLVALLEFMDCELQYRATALPELCRQAGERSHGVLRSVFLAMAEELSSQISPNARLCMEAVLARSHSLDETLRSLLMEFSMNLGVFDIAGQLKGLEHTRRLCCDQLEELLNNKSNRLRSYQTLGLCAGAAIAILLV